jgi:pimeloyl-ACP methyl ester carboxylesterase
MEEHTVKLEIISKYPVENQHPTPLLFIHGTLHTAACWDVHFLDYFAQQGYAAHAVNLRGHGNSEGREKLRWTRIADFAEDLEITVRQLPSPPILIGHSMGGFIIQKYLEDHVVPAAVLLSSPSPIGLLPTAIRTARRQPWAFAKVNLTLSLRPLIATPQLVGEAFFSNDLPHELLVEYWKQTQDDSYMAFLDMVALDLPKPKKVKTPLLVLGAARDNMIGLHEIEATARAYHTKAEIIPDVAHNSMLEQGWQIVADRILAWLNERQFVDASVPVPVHFYGERRR